LLHELSDRHGAPVSRREQLGKVRAATHVEVRRVLHRATPLRFYEHVRSEKPAAARFQRAADLVWPHVSGGCHRSRDSLGAIERSGFTVTSLRLFSFLGAPHGTATSPPA